MGGLSKDLSPPPLTLGGRVFKPATLPVGQICSALWLVCAPWGDGREECGSLSESGQNGPGGGAAGSVLPLKPPTLTSVPSTSLGFSEGLEVLPISSRVALAGHLAFLNLRSSVERWRCYIPTS